jgi:trans-AT polyketide synthase/acyltransferase/oxidoreductase domain-containing protein
MRGLELLGGLVSRCRDPLGLEDEDLPGPEPGLDEIPGVVRQRLEKDIFRASLAEVWTMTRAYWAARDGEIVTRAEADPKVKMALVFRWYLGMGSRWATSGEAARSVDYQIWCGPAMGAFNAWAAGSFLEEPAARGVVQIARNLMEGAAVITRGQQLRALGVAVPAAAFDYRPRILE